jgi:hypothetical protein
MTEIVYEGITYEVKAVCPSCGTELVYHSCNKKCLADCTLKKIDVMGHKESSWLPPKKNIKTGFMDYPRKPYCPCPNRYFLENHSEEYWKKMEPIIEKRAKKRKIKKTND